MRLTIVIDLGNEAMQDGYDAYQAIAKSNIPHHRGGPDDGTISDGNGNTVGTWIVAEPTDIVNLHTWAPGEDVDADALIRDELTILRGRGPA